MFYITLSNLYITYISKDMSEARLTIRKFCHLAKKKYEKKNIFTVCRGQNRILT